MIGFLIVFLLLPAVLVGGLAVCAVNGVATYMIATRTRRSPRMWTTLAVIPGLNVLSSLYFYLTTILRMLDDLEALKAAAVFDRPPAGLPVIPKEV